MIITILNYLIILPRLINLEIKCYRNNMFVNNNNYIY